MSVLCSLPYSLLFPRKIDEASEIDRDQGRSSEGAFRKGAIALSYSETGESTDWVFLVALLVGLALIIIASLSI